MTSTEPTTTAATPNFFDRLEERSKSINSLLCVGLDPHINELNLAPDATEDERCDAAYTFCKTIVMATAPYAAAYKPNAAFFEALGPNCGVTTLRRVIELIQNMDDEKIPVLLDCKRGDIGSTASAYAESSYDHLKADAVTLSPLMGWDSVEPFVSGRYADKGAFLLCKTSNPGSNDVLTLPLSTTQTKTTAPNDLLYEEIARLTHQWGAKTNNNLGLVVGATDAEALSRARKAAGQNVWILSPGVGFQGGDLTGTMRSGLNEEGSGLLVPISRGISRSIDGDIAAKAKEFRDLMNAARDDVLKNGISKTTNIAEYQQSFLKFSLEQGVLKFGSFVLKSGRTSPYFFNAGLFATGAALSKLGRAYAASIMASPELKNDNDTTKEVNVNFDVIFGPAYKGISLGAVVAASLYSDYGVDVGFAYNRKEAKDHGEGGILVGASMTDKRVLVVDDVITAGTAIRESYTMLQKINAVPVGVSIALDRAEKRSLDDPVSAVQAVARDLQIPVVSIVSLPQLQAFLVQNPTYNDGGSVLERVTAYREQYGV
eukprot:CAMPEP_0196809224 /NCGR_PEP_ID=MMETSP1362-20130617/9183_1 /TAXON_ID=163516 /ORGANISM="Leptocylindrus danicus, Strain CCMP1856" /LENGTH=543 /DNA_ID=CAMNT_0042183843 /DNA_START=56 /DNA_END=1687 /DNA_ORIENTATION=+